MLLSNDFFFLVATGVKWTTFQVAFILVKGGGVYLVACIGMFFIVVIATLYHTARQSFSMEKEISIWLTCV